MTILVGVATWIAYMVILKKLTTALVLAVGRVKSEQLAMELCGMLVVRWSHRWGILPATLAALAALILLPGLVLWGVFGGGLWPILASVAATLASTVALGSNFQSELEEQELLLTLLLETPQGEDPLVRKGIELRLELFRANMVKKDVQ